MKQNGIIQADFGYRNWRGRIAGRVRTLGKRVYRKVSRVRIPLSPPIKSSGFPGLFTLNFYKSNDEKDDKLE